MSYASVQTQVLTLLQLMSQFDSTNSAEKDFRILAHGKSQYAVLLRGGIGVPGRSGQIDASDGNKTYTRRDDYNVEISLYARYVTDQLQVREDLTTLTDAVEAHFDKYPSLDSFTGIIDAKVDLVGDPDEWGIGSGTYWRQVVTVEVAEISTVYMAEDGSHRFMRWDGQTAWNGSGQWQ